VGKHDAVPWCRSAETVATATARVKSSVGDRRRQSRPDDFGDMLDSLDEGYDPGLLQVRNALAHGRRGRDGERDMCGRLVLLAAELPASMPGWSR